MTITLTPGTVAIALFVAFIVFVVVCVLRTPRQRKPWTPPEGYMLEPTTSQSMEL